MLADLQRVLIKMLTAAPPDEVARAQTTLSPEERKLLESIERDGFRMTSLLVRKLRFERICRGDVTLEEWFDHEPKSFVETFEAYNRDVPPTEFFPRDEAKAFRKYFNSRNIVNPVDPPASKEA